RACSRLEFRGSPAWRQLWEAWRRVSGHDHIDFDPNEFGGQFRKSADVSFVRSKLEPDVLRLDAMLVFFACCAEAASRQATAPMTSEMKSRRLIGCLPRGRQKFAYRPRCLNGRRPSKSRLNRCRAANGECMQISGWTPKGR